MNMHFLIESIYYIYIDIVMSELPSLTHFAWDSRISGLSHDLTQNTPFLTQNDKK